MKPGIYTTEQALFLYEISTKDLVPTQKDIATQVATGELLVVLGAAEVPGYYEVYRGFDGYHALLSTNDADEISQTELGRIPDNGGETNTEVVLWTPTMREHIIERCAALLDIKEKSKKHGIYIWGGVVLPDVDCSALVQSVYREEAGIVTRRNSGQLFADATPISKEDILPGDLVFFRNDNGNIFHVGICKNTQEYYHSSGYDHGHGGMGSNYFGYQHGEDEAAVRNNYYASRIAGYGRIEKNHKSHTDGVITWPNKILNNVTFL